jgi:hypothetical protein
MHSHLLGDEFNAQRIDGLKRTHFTFGVPQDLSDIVEFVDFFLVEIIKFGHVATLFF